MSAEEQRKRQAILSMFEKADADGTGMCMYMYIIMCSIRRCSQESAKVVIDGDGRSV